MGNVDERLKKLGLVLPGPFKLPVPPPVIDFPFAWARVHGGRVHLSAHGPQNPDGSLAPPFGKVGEDVNMERASQAVKLATLALLGSLQRAIGDLDRVTAWLSLQGAVNVSPNTGFMHVTTLFNLSSQLIVDLFGAEVGTHSRSVLGVLQLPMNLPVTLAAEVAFE